MSGIGPERTAAEGKSSGQILRAQDVRGTTEVP
jgi:hypothetical protein